MGNFEVIPSNLKPQHNLVSIYERTITLHLAVASESCRVAA